MSEGDAVPRCWGCWKVLRDLVIKTNFALLDQHHDCRCRELLGHRTNSKNGIFRGGSVPLNIGEPVALRLDNLSVAHDGERDPGDVKLLQLPPIHRAANLRVRSKVLVPF